jgi:hypothetical protein
MMENLPELPEKIWLLIEKIPYEELNADQKELVARYLSEESYLQLSFASRTMHQHLAADKQSPVPERLNERFFDSIQSKKKTYTIPLWQAAAVFVLMTAGWLLSLIFRTESSMVMNTIHDTVYVAQSIPTTVIQRDTVYIYKASQQKKNKKVESPLMPNRLKTVQETSNNLVAVDGGIRLIEGEELINKLQQGKGISMAEDSLYKRIGYAGI